jgi:hypothetical protein
MPSVFQKNGEQPVMKTHTLLVAAALSWLPFAAQAQPASGDTDLLMLSRELLEKYYETEKLLGRERAEWRLGRELLSSRVELMEAQLNELVTKMAEEKSKITESDTEREKLDAQNQELGKTQTMQVDAIEKLEARVRKLWPLLPEILQTKVRGQYERLPDPNLPRADVRASVGERFLAVLAVLNEATKFHSDVTVVNERRRLASGKELEVETIYFGLGIGYFAGADPTEPVAGMLIPGEKSWEATEIPEAAARVSDMIAMYKSAKLAEFVPVPVRVR